MMKKFVVETISIFKHTYVIECEQENHAADAVVMGEVEEFSQNHIDENIISVREIADAEIIALCDRENAYLKEWTNEQKMSLVRRVIY